MKPVLVISDLHLSAERPEISRIFFRFLEREAPQAAALYILGDLFEYWAGDDDLAEPLHAEAAAALKRLTTSGVPVQVIPGNRDFLLGPRFEQATGATVLGDELQADICGTPTLLLHGDTLCTDDARYQAYRAAVRKPWLRRAFLALPLSARKRLIGGLRRTSEREVTVKRPEIMDVNQDAVAQALRAHGYPRLIHGHTHRPARHVHNVDGRNCERWVLPAWYESGGYLRCGADGVQAVGL